MRRPLIRYLTAALPAGAACLGLWWCWPSLGDPLGHLPRPSGPARLVEETGARTDGRTVRRVALDAGALGTVRLVLSLPDPAPPRRLPVLFVLGGLRGGGAGAIDRIADPGGNALVGFDYPIDRGIRGLGFLLEAPTLRRQVFAVPGQAVAALDWLRTQPWADSGRVTPVGVSLGALFLPAVLRLDAKAARLAVFAYGGADLGLLARNALADVAPRWLHPAIAPLARLALRPVEPAEHVPHLDGEFLAVGSAEPDAMVPAASARALERLLPDPKTVLHLPGGHVRRTGTILPEMERAVRAWLVERGAATP
jgi:hypothetical protein